MRYLTDSSTMTLSVCDIDTLTRVYAQNIYHKPAVLFAISLMVIGFIVLLLTSSFAYTNLHQPYSDGAMTVMRLFLTAAQLLLAWCMDWLESADITRIGRW